MKTKTLIILSIMVTTFSDVVAQTPTDTTTVARQDSTAVREKSLEGVTITAQRQLIKQDIDRVGYDVQADESARTQNVVDMLRKVPMVTIDGEDNILVKGNANYKIYKNGHPDPSLSKNAKEIFRLCQLRPSSALR